MPQYLVLSVETTGLEVGKHALLEFSLALCDTEAGIPRKILLVRYEVEAPAWQAEALSLHSARVENVVGRRAVLLKRPGSTLEFCRSRGIPVTEAIVGEKSFPLLLAEDLFPLPAHQKEAVWLIAGKNPAFGLGFLEKDKWWQVFKLKRDYHTFDIGNLLLLFDTPGPENGLLKVKRLKQYTHLVEKSLDFTGLGFNDSVADVLWSGGLVHYCYSLFRPLLASLPKSRD